jgi:uncharacterized membrane protein YeaQ/YmgE (transglycosylase-associated protein family)
VALVTGFVRTFRAELIPVRIFARLAVHFLWVAVIGFIAGIIARLLAPGPNNPAGFILTTLLGIAGAFIATFIGQAIGWYRPDQGAGLIGAVVGALIVLFVWHRLVAATLSQTPAPDAGSRLDRYPARRLAFDDDRARAARNGQKAVGPPRFQNGLPRLFRCYGHQCGDDLDLAFKILGETLRSQNRIVECRRIAPYPAQAVLCFPYLAHVTP